MENAGEHLVGQYLRQIKNCDFVEYNLQTKFKQGEIDVVGIDSVNNKVYICEVATHLETGLQYVKNNRPDNVKRFISKFEKNIEYAKLHFKEYECFFMLWTPIVKIPKKDSAIHSQLRDILEIESCLEREHKVKLEIIYNEKYLDCISELRENARKTTQEMKSPIMRFLQIEEKLIKMRKMQLSSTKK